MLLLSLASAVVLPWGGQPGSATVDQWRAVTANMLLGGAALALLFIFQLGERLSYVAIALLALLLRVIAITAAPLLEDDHFRYLWDGFQTYTQGNPYQFAPADFFAHEQLAVVWQDVLSQINNPDLKTIYGPVLQGLFLFAYWISPADILPIQAGLLLIDCLLLHCLWRAGASKCCLLAYAMHPLVLQEAMSSVHPDALLGGLLLLAALQWYRGRAISCGVLLGIACATKISALVVLPLFCMAPGVYLDRGIITGLRSEGRWLATLLMAMTGVLLLLYLPIVISGASEWESLLVFGNEWRFNPLLFRLLDVLLPSQMVRVICAVSLIGFCLLLCARVRQSARQQLPVVLLLLLLLIFSPVVNPWYWLWILPLAVYHQRWSVILVASLAPLSYYNSSVLAEAGLLGNSVAVEPFLVPWWITILQLVVISWATVREWRWFTALQSTHAASISYGRQ